MGCVPCLNHSLNIGHVQPEWGVCVPLHHVHTVHTYGHAVRTYYAWLSMVQQMASPIENGSQVNYCMAHPVPPRWTIRIRIRMANPDGPVNHGVPGQKVAPHGGKSSADILSYMA